VESLFDAAQSCAAERNRSSARRAEVAVVDSLDWRFLARTTALWGRSVSVCATSSGADIAIDLLSLRQQRESRGGRRCGNRRR
jgi:hypothetical protein